MVASKVGRKFVCLRATRCIYAALVKMYKTFEAGLAKAWNAMKLDTPVPFNQDGDIGTDEADAFGHAVTIRYTWSETIIVANKTASSTHEIGDGNNSGHKSMVPIGNSYRIEASGEHSHFTAMPFTRLSGELVIVAIVFIESK